MLLSPLADFFSRLNNRRKNRRVQPNFRPQLETLEERLCPSTYSNTVLSNGPVAYYQLNDAANTVTTVNGITETHSLVDSSKTPPGTGTGTNGGYYNTAGVLYQQTPGPIFNDPTNSAVTFNGITSNPGYGTIYTSPFATINASQGLLDPFGYPPSGNTSNYTASFETWFKTNPSTYDGSGGNSYSQDSLNRSTAWASGVVNTWKNGSATDVFKLGPADAKDMIYAASTLRTITLPKASYTSIDLLGFHWGGTTAPNEIFTVNYTDGTTTTFAQAFHDWVSNPTAGQLFTSANNTSNQNGNATSGGNIITGLPWYTPNYLYVGEAVSGAGIPAGTTITGFPSGNDVKLSNAFTGTSGPVTLTFGTDISAGNVGYSSENIAATNNNGNEGLYLDHKGGSGYANSLDLFTYSFTPDPTKTVASIRLPTDNNFHTLAINVDSGSTSTSVDLSSGFNQVGIVSDAKAFTGGVILGQTDASGAPGVANTGNGHIPAVYVGTNGHVYADLFYLNQNTSRQIQSGPVNDGNWHYLAVTYDNGVQTLYIDGSAVGTSKGAEYSYGGGQGYNYFLGTGRADGWTATSTAPWNGWSYYDGSLSEAAIYATALTPGQVANHYWTGIGHVSNLAITNTVAHDATATTATYTITVTNTNTAAVENGPEAGIVVNDPFPSTLYSSDTWTATYTGAGSTGPASGAGGPLNATITLAPGGTAVFTVQAALTGDSAPFDTKNTATASAEDMVPTALSVYPGFEENTLSWTAPSPAATGNITYNIYRGTAPGGEGATPIATGLTGTSYTDSGLLGGTTTYYYTVTAVYSAFSNFESQPTNEASGTPSDGALVPGLTTQYYYVPGNPGANGNFSSQQGFFFAPSKLVQTVNEPNIVDNDFTNSTNWQANGGTPANPNYLPTAITSVAGSNNFSIAWTGVLKVPTTGTYSFETGSDDGSVIFLNGAQITNNWFQQGVTFKASGPISLTAGSLVPIQVYYEQGGGGSTNYLEWVTPGAGSYTFIPAANLFSAPLPAPVPSTASFVTTDTTTHGSWEGTYGSQGYFIAQGPQNLPSNTSVGVSGQNNYTWANPTTDPRALQMPGTSNRIASLWYNNSTYTINVGFADQASHQVALYALDWDSTGRSETITVEDSNTGKVLDTQSVGPGSITNNGEWFVWNVKGNVQFVITYTGGYNSFVSGVFFGGAGAPFTGQLPAWSPDAASASNTFPVFYPATTLTVQKIGPSAPVNAGSQFSYQVILTNTGVNTAYYVDLKDVLPAGETFVSDSGNLNTAGGVFTLSDPAVGSNGTIDDTIYSLAPGAQADFDWTVQTSASQLAGPLTNTVVAAAANAGTAIDAGSTTPIFNYLLDTDVSGGVMPQAQTTTGVTNGSEIVTGLATASLVQGMTVTGTGIPVDTTITSIDSATQIHISRNFAGTTGASTALTFPVTAPIDLSGLAGAGTPKVQTTTGVTNASAVITGLTTAGLFVGMPVTGLGFAPNTVIGSVDSATQVTLSNPFTLATGTSTTLTFGISLPVSNPAPASLFQTERTGASTYTIGGLTAGGTYNVRLDFAELDGNTAGQRQFNVSINGTQVLTNFDVYTAAGGKGDKAVVQQFPAVANGSGQIVVALTAGAAGTPEINGIEVNPASTAVVNVVDQANLTVTKTVTNANGDGSVTPGNNLIYSVTIKNTGPSDAQSVDLKDVLPASETFVSDSGFNNGNQSTSGVTNGSTVITGLATGTLFAGEPVTGIGIPANTTIARVDSGTQITLNNAFTGTTGASTTLTFGAWTKSDPAVGSTGTIDDSIDVLPAGASATFTWTVAVLASTPGSVQETTTGVTNASPKVTGLTTGSLAAGMAVSGTGVPAGTTIASVDSPTQVTLSNAFTGTSGASTVLTFGTVNTINNSVTGSSTTDDVTGKPASATATAKTPVSLATPNLTVTKTVSAATVTPGNNLTYTITLANSGNNNASSVVLTDPLPAGETLVSATQTAGTPFAQSISGTTITESQGLFFKGQSATFTIVVNVGAGVTVPTTLRNIASATATNRPTFNSEADATVTYPPTNLTVTKTGAPGSVLAGSTTKGNVTYTLGVKNTGTTNPAYGITLTDPLPAGETFVSFSGLPAGWTETDPGAGKAGTVTFSSPVNSNPLAAGASIGNITIVASVPASTPAGTLKNIVTANSVNLLSTGNVLTAEADTTVTNSATLQLAKTATTTGGIFAGNTLNYNLVLTNKGPSDAFDSTGTQGPTITDTLPTGVTFTKINGTLPTGWTDTVSGQTVTFTDSNPMAVGTSGNISFQVTVAPSYTASSVSNTASAVATGDAKTPVNSNTVTNSVSDKAVLSLAKSVATAGGIYPGNNLNYTLVLTNSGPSDAFGATITDTLPTGESFVAINGTLPTGWTDTVAGQTVTFTDSNPMAPGTSGNLSFKVLLAPSFTGTTISNTATAAASDAATATSNTVTNTVNAPQANFTVSITAAGGSPGKNLIYTVTVQNTGPSNAYNATVTVPIPVSAGGSATTFVSATSAPGWSDTPLPAVGSTGGSVTFSNASFAPSGTATTFTVVVKVPVSTANGDTITNTATAKASDAVTATASTTTTVSNQSNLVVTMSAAPTPVAPGQYLTYTVTIQDTGTADAFNTTLTVPIPVGSDGTKDTFVSVSPTTLPVGWSDTLPAVGSTGGNVVFSNADFAPSGTPTTFTITVGVPNSATNGSTITNKATGGADNAGPGGSSDYNITSGNVIVSVVATANLTVKMTAAPNPVLAGNQLTYTATVQNSGPNDAANAILSVPVPTGTSFVSVGALPANWIETDTLAAGATTGNLTFKDTDLAPSTSPIPTFTMVFQVPSSAVSGSTITDAATASADDALPVTSGNVTTTVSTQADLTVTKTTASAFVNPGSNFTYNITITNSGPSDAQGVVLTDPIPTGLTFVSVGALPAGWTETDPGAGNNGTVTFTDTNPLTANSPAAAFTIVVNVPASTVFFTQFTNKVTATSTTPTSAGSTLSASATITAAPVADLILTKSGPTTVVPGQTFTYTVTLNNTGPNAATSASVADPLPAGATFVSDSPLPAGWTETNPGVGNNGTVTFSNPSFGVTTATFTITVTTSQYIFTPVTLSNTASATATDAQVPVVTSNTFVTNVTPSTNAQYVNSVYEKLLNRPADPSAIYWVNQLNAGMAPSTFVQAVEQSSEYLNDLVSGLYYRYLNRAPDAGAQTWVNMLASGVSIAQVTADILGSQEFYLDSGGTDTSYILALYQDLLNRAPTTAELNYWLNFLDAGLVRNGNSPSIAASLRTQIALDFLTSAEYEGDLVNSYYLNYLYRSADLAGLNYWTNQLQSGLSDQTVLAAIFGSNEGYTKNS